MILKEQLTGINISQIQKPMDKTTSSKIKQNKKQNKKQQQQQQQH